MRGVALALVVAGVVVTATRWGSFVAGGSDSYCYIGQAERWAAVLAHPLTERVQVVEPLALEAPWPDAARAFAPVGYAPSRTVPGANVPVCASGLSLFMAPLMVIGGTDAAFLALPFFGALLTVATYVAGGRYGGRVGLAAAFLVACSPTFLYQVVQPMSDVPAAALWMTAVACVTGTKPKHLVMAGLASGAAILVRPNLVPLAAVIGLFILTRPERTWRQRVHEAVRYAAACVPGCVAVGVIQHTFYGSPWSSGYGDLGALFSLQHVSPNTRRYASWLWQAYSPVILLAVASPLVIPGALGRLLIGLFIANLALYLPYVVFNDWSFTRFLLPTLPLVLILLVATVDGLWRRMKMPSPATGVAVLALVLGAWLANEAKHRYAFDLQRFEGRFARAGRYVGEHLPANALVISNWESGSIRFYGHRRTVVWDQIDPQWLDRAIAWARGQGLEPYLVLERWEEAPFRRHFGRSGVAALDWPPMAEIAAQVRIYRLDDRARYLRGEGIPTAYAR